jgi:signal transduction histidine kinase
MNLEKHKRQALISWVAVSALVVLAAVLGALQYGWIDEVSRAERDRIRASLHTSLLRLSRDFNNEITAACAGLFPGSSDREPAARERQYAQRYAQWRDSSRHGRLIRAVSIAIPQGNDIVLRGMDTETGVFRPRDWPPTWSEVRDELKARLHGGQDGRHFGSGADDSADLIEFPDFGGAPEPGKQPRALDWLLVEFDLGYIRTVLIPELLQRDLGGGASDYQAEVITKEQPSTLIYQSGTDRTRRIGSNADAAVSLFGVDWNHLRPAPRPVRPPDSKGGFKGDFADARRGEGLRRGPPPEPNTADRGRWELLVRHRAGSVEAVVAQARSRNLALVTGILLLIVATVSALVRFTRRAQSMVDLQMEFVAGVSHELRTPLSVIRTAGYNLQSKVADDPARVHRYGALIQSESERLTALVEQVLGFANAEAGRVIGETEPVDVKALIDEAVFEERKAISGAGCEVRTQIAQGLPPVLADKTTLKHALQNLISNAVKYGKREARIEIIASLASHGSAEAVEIRVQDHGEGIPANEIGKVFDPFYRGRKAVADQVHGTGLGLSLSKRIIEAHRGSLTVHSKLGEGAEFVVWIPVAAALRSRPEPAVLQSRPQAPVEPA